MQIKEIAVKNVLEEIFQECQRARTIHRELASTHEAHSVILEEFEEWWESVKVDSPDDKELIQTAAMCAYSITAFHSISKWAKPGSNRRLLLRESTLTAELHALY